MTEILYDNGYILKYKFDKRKANLKKILIALKYDPLTRQPIIQKLERHPGQVYANIKALMIYQSRLRPRYCNYFYE